MARPTASGPEPAGGDPAIPVRHIVMTGLMGSGKSTVGALVAARLGWPVRDSDAEIEAATGRTVREIRDLEGTDALHDVEAAQLLAALAAPGPDVVCAAASVADRDDCLAALASPGVVVVWLAVPPDVAARRFSSAAHRPRLGDDVDALLARQLAERGPRFASVARIVLDAAGRPPDELADAVVAGVSR